MQTGDAATLPVECFALLHPCKDFTGIGNVLLVECVVFDGGTVQPSSGECFDEHVVTYRDVFDRDDRLVLYITVSRNIGMDERSESYVGCPALHDLDVGRRGNIRRWMREAAGRCSLAICWGAGVRSVDTRAAGAARTEMGVLEIQPRLACCRPYSHLRAYT